MIEISDKERIAAYLRRDVGLHLYELGDLDPFFWPHTRWFASDDAMCLLYEHPAMPTVVALSDEAGLSAMDALLCEVAPQLPDEIYVHRSPGLSLPGFELADRGEHLRMMLASPKLAEADAIALVPADAEELEAFYADGYPDNWFDRRMLETGCYFAMRVGGALASVAGVHVYSEEQRVAALGNIATARAYRGRGLARLVTSACCRHLMSRVDHIGLNVKSDNAAAIACYRRLGFETRAGYREAHATRRRDDV